MSYVDISLVSLIVKILFNSMQEEREQRRHLRSQMEQMGMEKEALDRIAPLIDNPYLHGTGEYDNDPNTTNIYLSNLSLEVRNFFRYSSQSDCCL